MLYMYFFIYKASFPLTEAGVFCQPDVAKEATSSFFDEFDAE